MYGSKTLIEYSLKALIIVCHQSPKRGRNPCMLTRGNKPMHANMWQEIHAYYMQCHMWQEIRGGAIIVIP
jgi:hypothetical protein